MGHAISSAVAMRPSGRASRGKLTLLLKGVATGPRRDAVDNHAVRGGLAGKQADQGMHAAFGRRIVRWGRG